MKFLLIIKNEKNEIKVAHFGTTEKTFDELSAEFASFYSNEKKLKALKKGIVHCKFLTEKDSGFFMKELLSGKKNAQIHYESYCDPDIDLLTLLENFSLIKKETKVYNYSKYIGDFLFSDALFEINFAKTTAQYSTVLEKNYERWA